eukprot:762478-Hanusia_phi.AAC.5
MGGGLLQLVAFGAQDVYLTGSPQITFVKVVYRRHTNFAIESIEQTFNGMFDFGRRTTVQISRNGDLIHKLWLSVVLPHISSQITDPGFDILTNNYDRYVNYVGIKLLKTIEIEIGGQVIDRHYSDWMYIWNELSLPHSKMEGWQEMVGADSDMTSFKENRLYIPLEFWFCRNVGLALPLIALQYHEVKLVIELDTAANCTYNGTAYTYNSPCQSIPSISSASLWVDYIYLDTDERRRFAQMSHEYLIEQLQYTTDIDIPSAHQNVTYRMNFNHPCKELVWALHPSTYKTNQWYNYTDATINNTQSISAIDSNIFLSENIHGIQPDGHNPIESALIQLNGNDRFARRDGDYFSLVQPYQHHTNVPHNQGINVYSFALKPEDHQPSGTLNMSRIDTALLQIKSSVAGSMKMFATNYNILRILSGMGGLAYSN